MLSRDPTFDWALKSSFSDLISMFPPPWKGRWNSSWLKLFTCIQNAKKIESKAWALIVCGIWNPKWMSTVTWFVTNVVFRSALWLHIAQVNLFVEDLDLFKTKKNKNKKHKGFSILPGNYIKLHKKEKKLEKMADKCSWSVNLSVPWTQHSLGGLVISENF